MSKLRASQAQGIALGLGTGHSACNARKLSCRGAATGTWWPLRHALRRSWYKAFWRLALNDARLQPAPLGRDGGRDDQTVEGREQARSATAQYRAASSSEPSRPYSPITIRRTTSTNGPSTGARRARLAFARPSGQFRAPYHSGPHIPLGRWASRSAPWIPTPPSRPGPAL